MIFLFKTLPIFERLDVSYSNIRKDPSHNIPKVIGNNQFLHRSKSAHEADSNASLVLVESNEEEYLLTNTSYRSSNVTSRLLVNQKHLFQRVTFVGKPSLKP